jgi:EpsI family protein
LVANGLITADRVLTVAALAIVAVAAALGLSSSLALLHANWTAWYGPAEHGYLVLAASVWLAVTEWQASPPASLRPDWWALLPLGALVLLVLGLELVFINNARLLLLPPLLLATVAFVFGRAAAKRLVWPALFLYFALPQWAVLNGFLQNLTTKAVSYAVRWTGVPAFVDGNLVHLPSGTFEIASGCSGLNYLQAGTALAAFYGLLSLSMWHSRLALLAVAAGVAIAFNWIRVYAVILVGHVSEMQHYLITGEHHTFGWVLFMVAMVPVFLFATRLERLEAAPVTADAPRVSANAFPPASRLVVPVALAAAALLLLPAAMMPAAAVNAVAAVELPATLDDESRGSVTSGWSPVFPNASEDSASFGGASPAVEVYRAVYPHQDSEHRLLQPGNDFLGAEFRLLEEQRRNVALAGGGALEIVEYRGTLRQRPRVVWAWYWVAGTPVAGRYEARIADLRGLLQGRRDGVAIAVAAECVPDCDAAVDRLDLFTQRHERQLRWKPAAFQ